jgi:hypothetical protein
MRSIYLFYDSVVLTGRARGKENGGKSGGKNDREREREREGRYIIYGYHGSIAGYISFCICRSMYRALAGSNSVNGNKIKGKENHSMNPKVIKS